MRLPIAIPILQESRRTLPAVCFIALAMAFGAGISADAQDTPPTPADNVRYGYTIHQSIELGGHIADTARSGAVYDTMIDLQSGPRILSESLDLRAVDPSKTLLFDHLSTNSFGYGGDPNSVSLLHIGKGKLYDLRANFRRDRQYFDYDLLANPLIPPTSSPYVPILSSPHRFNTVRRMSNFDLTIAPVSRFSVRLGFNHNISQGPSYSTIHEGAEGLLTQFWRNSTDFWTAGLDWKPLKQTSLSYDQFVAHYKGDTSWQLTGLNDQLSDGTPVSLGVDLSSAWSTPCATPFAANGTVTSNCNAFLGYSRSAPTRTITPTEQLRFQSASIPKLTMNGRILYSASASTLSNFNEVFNGLTSRSALRQAIVTGSAYVRRLDVNADYSAAWQIAPRLSATNVFNFWDFRMPGTNAFAETDYAGGSLLLPPGATTATKTSDLQYLNQKTRTDTIVLTWDIEARADVTGGYRYRSRIITDAGGDLIPIHENWGIFGAALRPTPQLRINFNLEAMYADNSFARISPRQLQHYIVRSTYRPHLWLTINGTVNVRESRDNVETVNHLEHNRDLSLGASISPSDRWSLDLNYAYDSVYSSTIECYTSTPAPPSAGTAPAVCAAAGTPLLSNGYYNVPMQFGSIGVMLKPIKRVHLDAGYRTTAVDGTSDLINIRQVNSPIQSQFQSPYGNLIVDIAPNWSWRASYNFYDYGEGLPIGPTLPRDFHANVSTLAVRYAF